MLASTRRICRRAFQEYSNMPLDSGPLKKIFSKDNPEDYCQAYRLCLLYWRIE